MRPSIALVSLSTMLISPLAHAADGATTPPTPQSAPADVPLPPSPPGDGATAVELVKELEARGAKNELTARVTKEPLANAKRSLERARGARVAGDEAHAKMLDGLALEWAETARDLDRAAGVEVVAAGSAEKARDVATQAERARTLLEETQARRGRAAAELERIEADAKEKVKGAASAEEDRVKNAGKKKGGDAPKKAPDPKPKDKTDAPKPKKGAK